MKKIKIRPAILGTIKERRRNGISTMTSAGKNIRMDRNLALTGFTAPKLLGSRQMSLNFAKFEDYAPKDYVAYRMSVYLHPICRMHRGPIFGCKNRKWSEPMLNL